VAAWLAAYADGKEISAKDLAAMHDRSERWARGAIAEAKRQLVEVNPRAAVPAEEAPEAVVPEEVPLAALAPTAPEELQEPGKPQGRSVAMGGFIFGILGSVAANVMHAATSGAGLPAILASAFWPVALLLATEVLIRVRWPEGAWYSLAR